jgi:hypothetical protein
MEIETMLRNNAYLNARGDSETDSHSGRSPRWAEMLAFPNIRDCKEIETFLDTSGGLSIQSILNQPIGGCIVVQSWLTCLRKKGI